MLKIYFLLIITNLSFAGEQIQNNIFAQVPGDINQDGIVNILDVIITVNYVFSGDFNQLADLNEDSVINIVDILEIVNIIIYGWTHPFPQNILFIGNSYTYFNGGIHNHLQSMFLESYPENSLFSEAITAGGATLQSHFGNENTINTIQNGHWDYIIMQEQSTRPIDNPNLFFQFAELMNEEIINSGAETMFFMTWARENNPNMIEGLADAYNSIGEQLSADVCPVGRAWELSLDVDPEIVLYSNDGSHPNANGTYLTTCMFYSCIFRENPQGIEFVNDENISAEVRDYLQLIAWETYILYFNN